VSEIDGFFGELIRRTIRVMMTFGAPGMGGGTLLRELDRATHEHGLTTTGGMVRHTGVAGWTLGGGRVGGAWHGLRNVRHCPMGRDVSSIDITASGKVHGRRCNLAAIMTTRGRGALPRVLGRAAHRF